MPSRSSIPRILALSLVFVLSLPQAGHAELPLTLSLSKGEQFSQDSLRPAQSDAVRSGLESVLRGHFPSPNADDEAIFHPWGDATGADMRARALELFDQPDGLVNDYAEFELLTRLSEGPSAISVRPIPVLFEVEKWARRGIGVALVRAGPFFYVDHGEYLKIPSAGRKELRDLLGRNLILIPNLSDSTVSTYVGSRVGKFGVYTFPTLANFLNSDFPERMVVAGSVDGDLLVALAALGVKYIEGFDILESVVEEAREKLRINGYQDVAEGDELKAGAKGFFNVFQGDLQDQKEILSRLAFNGKETGFVSNIGTWPGLYNVTNADTISLMEQVPHVKLFIGSGYRKELGTDGFPETVRVDQKLLQDKGWRPAYWAIAHPFVRQDATITWSAVPAAGLETSPKEQAFQALLQVFQGGQYPKDQRHIISTTAMEQYPELRQLQKLSDVVTDLPIMLEGNGQNSGPNLVSRMGKGGDVQSVRYYGLGNTLELALSLGQFAVPPDIEVSFLVEAERQQASEGLGGFLAVLFGHLKIPEDRWNTDEQMAAIVQNLRTLASTGLETEASVLIQATTDFSLLRIGGRIEIPSSPPWIPEWLIITDRYPDRRAIQLHQLGVGGRVIWNTSGDRNIEQLVELKARYHRPMTVLEKQTDILDQGYVMRLEAGEMLETLRHFADPASKYPRIRFESIDDSQDRIPI